MGGVEKSLMQFLRFLVEEKHEVYLYLWTLPGILFCEIPPEVNILSPGKYPQSIKECNISNFHRFIIYRLSTLLTGSYKLWSKIIGKLLPFTFDVAISYSDNDYSRYCVIDNIEAKKKIQFFHHGCYDHDIRGAAQDAEYFSAYDSLVTVSDANRDMLLRRFPNLGEKIKVIHNLINIDEIIRLADLPPEKNIEDIEPDKGILILCTVGRLSEEKGTDLAYYIMKELIRRGVDFRWFFIGEEYDKGITDIFRQDSEILKRCVFTGVCKNPYPYIKACDIYVHPSRIESECLVIKEAMVLNKRVVGSTIPAIEEILDGLPGSSVADLTPSAFSDAIIDLSSRLNETMVCNRRIVARNEASVSRLRDLLSE